MSAEIVCVRACTYVCVHARVCVSYVNSRIIL